MTSQSPQHWTVGAMAMRAAYARLAVIAPDAVAAGDRPTILPAYYDDACRRRFIALRLHHPDLAWSQVEPLFALAAASLDYRRRVGPDVALQAIAASFDATRGNSPLAWRHVQALLDEAWSALARLQERHRVP